MYENTEICSECGGECCKNQAGETFPKDFGPDVKKGVREALLSGDWAIDWWEGSLDGTYSPHYIRPRHEGEPQVCPSWGGGCVFLEENGCSLNPEDRPTGCKMLEPRPDGNCVGHLGHSKKSAAKAWIPYQEFLKNMKEKLEKQLVKVGIR